VRVICLGEALIDLTPPKGKDLSTATRLGARVGGAPLNVAIHLKSAGATPHFVGTLSSDSFGDRIRSVLDRKKIDYSPKKPVDAPTRLSVIDHRADQPPFRFYGHRTADSRLTLRDVRRQIEKGADALYVSSLMMTDKRTAKIQMEAIRLANAIGNVVIVSDPNPRLDAWPDQDSMILATELLLAHSWITKLSLEDARALGWPDEPVQLVAHLKQRTSGYSIITDGERGCWLEDQSGVEYFPAPKVDTVDPTGAGDAFFARIIANALRDWALTPQTVFEASHAGALVAAKQGAF
jgi:fructan beta-fructosidase